MIVPIDTITTAEDPGMPIPDYGQVTREQETIRLQIKQMILTRKVGVILSNGGNLHPQEDGLSIIPNSGQN
jgi:hypothetical protein